MLVLGSKDRALRTRRSAFRSNPQASLEKRCPTILCGISLPVVSCSVSIADSSGYHLSEGRQKALGLGLIGRIGASPDSRAEFLASLGLPSEAGKHRAQEVPRVGVARIA